MEAPYYDPSIFTRVSSLRDAKRIILTDEESLSTDERWERETPHICDLIDEQIKLTTDSVVLDYGCGIGRVAKELIARHSCFVIGADIAPNMLALANAYVHSGNFLTCHPDALPILSTRQVDLVLAIWTLQHVANHIADFGNIKRMMGPHSHLFVVNEQTARFVPTTRGWYNDGIDIPAELQTWFRQFATGHMDRSVVGENQSARTFWGIYGNKGIPS